MKRLVFNGLSLLLYGLLLFAAAVWAVHFLVGWPLAIAVWMLVCSLALLWVVRQL